MRDGENMFKLFGSGEYLNWLQVNHLLDSSPAATPELISLIEIVLFTVRKSPEILLSV